TKFPYVTVRSEGDPVHLTRYGSCSRIDLEVLPTVYFFWHAPAPQLYTLSLHDALPISGSARRTGPGLHPPTVPPRGDRCPSNRRSEEHTSELQSRFDIVCRLLLEKKKLNKLKGRIAGETRNVGYRL